MGINVVAIEDIEAPTLRQLLIVLSQSPSLSWEVGTELTAAYLPFPQLPRAALAGRVWGGRAKATATWRRLPGALRLRARRLASARPWVF